MKKNYSNNSISDYIIHAWIISAKISNFRLSGIFFLVFLSFYVKAQNVNYLDVDKSSNGITLNDWVENYESRYGIDVVFEDKSILNKRIEGVSRSMSIPTFLSAILPGYYVKSVTPKIVLVLESRSNISNSDIIFLKKNGSFFNGRVYDGITKEPVIGANVLFTDDYSGTVTLSNGEFYATSKKDVLRAEVSYIGYEKRRILIVSTFLAKKRSASIALEPASGLLDNVSVSAKRQDENIEIKKMGIQRIEIESIKEMPTFLGEIDPIKGVTALPGVSSTGDLGAGFSVRGGDNSQNLILQDDAIIFNPTHLFGFFSAFNPDFINDITLLKGGGHSKFGGRVSSVLDINTRNGDLHKYKVSGGVGLVSSRVALEGPISKDNSSFMLGGRVSYSDWFVRSYENVRLKNSSANFYDLSAKFFQQINKKSFISLTGYFSHDDFNLGVDSTFNWTTKNLSVKWEQKHRDSTRSTLVLASSNYESGVIYDDEIFGFNYRNGISVITANYNLTHKLSEGIDIEAGVSNNFSKINVGESTPYSSRSNYQSVLLNRQKTIEVSPYVEGNFKLNDNLALSLGLRYGMYFRLGADEIYDYDFDNVEGRVPGVKDTAFYNNNEIISNYNGIEPRVSLRYLIGGNASVKVSYNRTQQFLHQVSATVSPSPVDFWISSSPNILPARSDQFSIGFFRNFSDNVIESSVEGFYKKTNNVVDYIAGVDLNLNPQIEAGLEQGIGYSYGLEVLLKKKEGKVNGWLAYTYSRSFRQITGRVPDLEINGGEKYPSVFDQPHQLALVMNVKLSQQAMLSSNFTYSTGRPITIPVSKYEYGSSMSVNNYSSRNSYRIPDYHRLDLSLTVNSKEVRGKWFSSQWVFSLYNVYARKNAYSIYFNSYGQAYKTSILGSVIPSITYNFKIN